MQSDCPVVPLGASAVGTAIGQMRDGKTRIISVSAPQRMGGDLAQVPMLRKQGYDVSLSNWRALIGPKGISVAQVAYWENVVTRVIATDNWKKILVSRVSVFSTR